MGKRFEVGVVENMEMIVIKDKRTEEVRVRCFKSEEDLSFLEALRDAAQELLDTLKADTSNDTDDTEQEQEEEKQSVLTMVQLKL